MDRYVRVVGALLVLSLAACNVGAPPIPAPQRIAAPDPSEIEHVLFLVGDPGEAKAETYPLVPRLQQDIEQWAQRLGGDSAVTVLFLGDIVYPLGMHTSEAGAYLGDSAVVAAQVGLVSGPVARQRRAQAYFMAGNHDWGLETEWEGYVRLKNLDSFLQRTRQRTGAQVRLVPEAGTGGPFVVDLGAHVRLLILDTAWWILDGGREARAEHTAVLSRVETAMRTAGGRHVVIAAHHPFQSAGPHGGEFSFWRSLGFRYLLSRSGAILQDLSSIPYRELKSGLRAIFRRTGPPAAFVAGHEHSLQVIEARWPEDPRVSIVSGSASKTSNVGPEKGMRFGRGDPGYMRLLVHKDGRMSVFVESMPARFKTCAEGDAECMARGIAAFETVHSQRIR